MMEWLRKSPVYPVLAGVYPAFHRILIFWVWQICSLLPVKKEDHI